MTAPGAGGRRSTRVEAGVAVAWFAACGVAFWLLVGGVTALLELP